MSYGSKKKTVKAVTEERAGEPVNLVCFISIVLRSRCTSTCVLVAIVISFAACCSGLPLWVLLFWPIGRESLHGPILEYVLN